MASVFLTTSALDSPGTRKLRTPSTDSSVAQGKAPDKDVNGAALPPGPHLARQAVRLRPDVPRLRSGQAGCRDRI